VESYLPLRWSKRWSRWLTALWEEWSRGKPISQHGLADLFRLFGFKTKGVRQTDGLGKESFPKCYNLHDPGLKDELERHPRPEAPQATQPSNDRDNPDNSKHHKGSDVADSKTPETPHKTTGVVGVADGVHGVAKKLPTYMSSIDVPAENDEDQYEIE
jgi:hypothetical protein